jgi:hypothetical protein
MLAHLEPNTQRIHTTNTVDFVYVLSGEVCLDLDDGVKNTFASWGYGCAKWNASQIE